MRAAAHTIEHGWAGRPRRRLLGWGLRFLGVAVGAVFVSAAFSAVSTDQRGPESDGWRLPTRTGPAMFEDAIAAGREADGVLYPCRGMVNQDMHVGRIRPDFGGCHIGFDGREAEVKPFELLTATWRPVESGTGGALVAGTERVVGGETPFSTTPLFACRASYQGATHSGQATSGEKGCSFGYGGKRVVVTSYDLLQSAPWLAWVSATARTLPDTAVASGAEGGEPFYACRAADKNGLHPGKVKRGPIGCSIVSDGREAAVDRFEVLVPRWAGGHAGTTPVGAYLSGRENGVGQFVCRAQNRDSVQVGKVSDPLGGCHIGMQGREVVIVDYEVLAQ